MMGLGEGYFAMGKKKIICWIWSGIYMKTYKMDMFKSRKMEQ